MERLSDTAIEIINDLHTERLEYASEYIPLIDAANRLSDYEDTGLEPEGIKEFAEDAAYQFGYYFPIKDILYISTGGFSTLEWAFRILGWNDPHPVPECECEFPGCHEYATCGTPTKDGYKRLCGKHFAELAREEAEAALALEGGTHEDSGSL